MTKKLTVAYFGSPLFSANVLERLIESKTVKVGLVVTQPDKPIGRQQKLTPSPVKLAAQKHRLPVFDQDDLSLLPQTINDRQIDLGLIFSYGKIIPNEILAAPRIMFPQTGFGFINIHPSLLPQYRGASPVVFSLLMGDKQTGVSIILLDEMMDHGPILAQETLPINETDTTPVITNKLTNLATSMVSKVITKLSTTDDQPSTVLQNHTQATITRHLTKRDGFIPLPVIQKAMGNVQIGFNEFPEIIKWFYQKNHLNPSSQIINTPHLIFNLYRALTPWPGVWTIINHKNTDLRLRLTDLTIDSNQLVILKVQLEGKREVDFETFNRAYPIFS